ncbi:unnamed protein product [Cochlearia groenlandica]
MGVKGGGLVRNIFFRNKSFESHHYNNNVTFSSLALLFSYVYLLLQCFQGRNNLSDKKRWSSVRSYLCGDEFNSVLAVDDSVDTLLTMSHQLCSELITPFGSVLAIEDSASVKHLDDDESASVSVKSSEATVTQPLLHQDTSKVDIDNQSETTETHIPKNKHHQTTPVSRLFLEEEEDAAVIIQSAFRTYLATRRHKEEETLVKEESFSGDESSSQGKVSMGTSLEVQTCNSMKAPFASRKRVSAHVRTIQTNKSQALRIKEEWDDSTVSSTISKLRIQSRIEAMTKRERALAYAFSQQLRICSKKKQIDRSNEDDPNIGWSWLERWMATRLPDNTHIQTKPNIQTEAAMKNQRLVRKNLSYGISGGELESCASNDIPLQYESIAETLVEEPIDLQSLEKKPSKSKRKSVPSNKNQTRHNKLWATTRDLQQHTKKAKKPKTSEKIQHISK